MNLSINQVVEYVSGELDYKILSEKIITGVSTDSRKICAGDLFIPLVGDKYDGHAFIKLAEESGAIAILCQSDKDISDIDIDIPVIRVLNTLEALQSLAMKYRDLINPTVIGITGSNGKTTTKDLIYSVLNSKFKVHKTQGNLNNHIGVPLTLLSMPEDTDIAVVEMGMSNFGEIEELSKIARPDIAVITNIGESHIEYLKTRENITLAKLEIIKGLKQGGKLLLPGDEQLIKKILTNFKIDNNIEIRLIGNSQNNDYYTLNVENKGTEGVSFIDSYSDDYYIPLLGMHNVINALMAIQIGKILEVSKQDIHKGLANIQLTGMRLEKLKAKNGSLILNDAYNASPTSMQASLKLLNSLDHFKNKIAVLGDMLELGEEAEKYHEEIGELCTKIGLDYLLVTGELGEFIIRGAKKCGIKESQIKYFENIDLISDFILENSTSNTVILIKASRGIKLEKVVNQLKA